VQVPSLFAFAVFVVALEAVLTVVGVAAEWPTQFGDPGDPDDVARAWIGRGTAVSAPLGPISVLLAAAILSRRRDRWELVGVGLIAVVALLMCIGALGEAFAEATPDVPRGVLVGSGILGVAIAAGLLGLCVRQLAERRRGRVP
jgi:hypothetical protein